MKNVKLVIVIILFLGSTLVHAQSQDWSALAKRIVNETAQIKAGEIVLIEGGAHTMPLMEQIAAEVHRQGGMPQMMVQSDIELTAWAREKPEANLSDYPKHMMAIYKEIDYLIRLPGSKDFKKIYTGVDPKRFALASKNTEKIMAEMAAETHYSEISIDFPTEQIAEANKIDFKVYEKMHWAGVNADSKVMAEKGKRIMDKLKGAKKVRITTKAGTDFTFSMGDRLVFADDGLLSQSEKDSDIMFARYAFLPGGWMDFAPIESSVNGKVVVPFTRCEFEPMKDVTFNIENGVLKNFSAKEGGECYERQVAPQTGDKNKISVFVLGLNPQLKVVQKGETFYAPRNAAGSMGMSFGGNNGQYGGSTSATGGFGFPLIDVTLEVDGEVMIKDGKLM